MLESKRLEIHPAPAQAIEKAVDVLSHWVDVDKTQLGGGTALEARWHHRTSTDLDFFIAGEDGGDNFFYNELDYAKKDLIRLVAQGVVNQEGLVITQRSVLHFKIDETPVSLARTDQYYGTSVDEVESKTGVFLSSTEDILTKKLINRLLEKQSVVERDAYDFLVAIKESPNDLANAWNRLDNEEKKAVVEIYRNAIRDRVPMGIDNAVYHGLADDLWNNVLKLFQNDLSFKPPIF